MKYESPKWNEKTEQAFDILTPFVRSMSTSGSFTPSEILHALTAHAAVIVKDSSPEQKDVFLEHFRAAMDDPTITVDGLFSNGRPRFPSRWFQVHGKMWEPGG